MNTARGKVLSQNALLRAVQNARRKGRRVVFTSGCFDLLHIGHLRCLEQAAGFGDCLVVGVNANKRVRELKGPGRPIVPARRRAELLAGFACVDYVTVFGGQTPRALLAALRPDVYAKGGDWPLRVLRAQDLPVGATTPGGAPIAVRRLRQIPGARSSKLVARIQAGAK